MNLETIKQNRNIILVKSVREYTSMIGDQEVDCRDEFYMVGKWSVRDGGIDRRSGYSFIRSKNPVSKFRATEMTLAEAESTYDAMVGA